MLRYTDAEDMIIGLLESVVFGAMVASIGCYKGLNCREGAEGVGRATTDTGVSHLAVVTSNIARVRAPP